MEGLKPQLDRLKQAITTTTVDGDLEETERRTELTRYVRRSPTLAALVDGLFSVLAEIERRSQELLTKGTAARFVDKAGDSGEVVKLIERLREAIIHYQVSEHCFQHRIQLTAGQISQQQAIYDRITDLAVSDFRFVSALHADNRLFCQVVFRFTLETP